MAIILHMHITPFILHCFLNSVYRGPNVQSVWCYMSQPFEYIVYAFGVREFEARSKYSSS